MLLMPPDNGVEFKNLCALGAFCTCLTSVCILYIICLPMCTCANVDLICFPISAELPPRFTASSKQGSTISIEDEVHSIYTQT